MQKPPTGKLELSPPDCVFNGVPPHKLQRIRELQAGNWRATRTGRSVLSRPTTEVLRV